MVRVSEPSGLRPRDLFCVDETQLFPSYLIFVFHAGGLIEQDLWELLERLGKAKNVACSTSAVFLTIFLLLILLSVPRQPLSLAGRRRRLRGYR